MKYQETDPKIIQAINLANKGQYENAVNALSNIAIAKPENNLIKVNIASLYFVMNKLDDVEAWLDSFMDSEERSYVEFFHIASDLYIRSACFSKAVNCSEMASQLFPNDESTWGMLAQSCFEARAPDQAIKAVESLLKLNPNNFEGKVLYANMLSGKGDFEHSEKLLRDVLSVAPWHSVACSVLSKCKKHEKNGDQVLALFDRAIATKNPEPQEDPEAKARVLYAKAKIHNDQSCYSEAWKQAEQANAIKSKLSPFNQVEYTRFIDLLINQFSKVDYDQNNSGSNREPIFIVGMPRSGTTLTEQILSLDENIYPGGEKRGLDYALLMTFKGQDYLQGIEKADRTEFQELATRYHRYYSAFSNFSGDRIVNKVPANYLHLGIFKMMFPNLKIINMQRNPLDVSVSIFFEHFSERLNYTNNMADIILVYKEYKRLMAFWETQFKENIINISYHDMTENYEENKQKIIDFCNLKIPENTDYSNAKNLVETPSVWQVRQGIYKSSVDRWKRYENQLQNFTYILEE